MGIKTVRHPSYRPDLAPCDFWLFPKLRGSRYERIKEMKEAVMKVIDTLTQEDFHGAFQKLLERYFEPVHHGHLDPLQEHYIIILNVLLIYLKNVYFEGD